MAASLLAQSKFVSIISRKQLERISLPNLVISLLNAIEAITKKETKFKIQMAGVSLINVFQYV